MITKNIFPVVLVVVTFLSIQPLHGMLDATLSYLPVAALRVLADQRTGEGRLVVLKALAEKDDAWGLRQLGLHYLPYSGYVFQLNATVTAFKRAADLGDSAAQYHLAQLIFAEKTTSPLSTAYRLLALAAVQKYELAQKELLEIKQRRLCVSQGLPIANPSSSRVLYTRYKKPVVVPELKKYTLIASCKGVCNLCGDNGQLYSWPCGNLVQAHSAACADCIQLQDWCVFCQQKLDTDADWQIVFDGQDEWEKV